MATETVENYLKAIHRLAGESPDAEATIGSIAAIVGVTPGTATAMVRKLSVAKLARYKKYGGVSLTPKGTRLATDVVRRHRIIELFLVQIVGLDWSEVHEEAERLEHAISARLLERLDEMLGRPQADPHGDPIPTASGQTPTQRLAPLTTCAHRQRVTVRRVLDQNPDFLRFLDKSGLRPDSTISVHQSDSDADLITVAVVDGRHISMSRQAAEKILVEPT